MAVWLSSRRGRRRPNRRHIRADALANGRPRSSVSRDRTAAPNRHGRPTDREPREETTTATLRRRRPIVGPIGRAAIRRRVGENEQPHELAKPGRHRDQGGTPEDRGADDAPGGAIVTNGADDERALGVENPGHRRQKGGPEPVSSQTPLITGADASTALVTERVIEELERRRRLQGDARGEPIETKRQGMDGNEALGQRGNLDRADPRRVGSRLEIDPGRNRRRQAQDEEEDGEQEKPVERSMTQNTGEKTAHVLLVNTKAAGQRYDRRWGTSTVEAKEPQTSTAGARIRPRSRIQCGCSGHTDLPSGRRQVIGDDGTMTP